MQDAKDEANQRIQKTKQSQNYIVSYLSGIICASVIIQIPTPGLYRYFDWRK